MTIRKFEKEIPVTTTIEVTIYKCDGCDRTYEYKADELTDASLIHPLERWYVIASIFPNGLGPNEFCNECIKDSKLFLAKLEF